MKRNLMLNELEFLSAFPLRTMLRKLRLSCSVLLAVISLSASSNSLSAQSPNYDDDIKPIFRTHCLTCHNEDDQEADVDLSTFAATMRGGSSGAIVKPGRPQGSTLFLAITHGDNVEAMPPEGPKLSDAEIKIVDGWIRGGLIEGKGGKSQLRTIGLAATNGKAIKSPMPEGLAKEVTKTIRPPVPQAIATSPGAQFVVTSGHEQVLLYGKTESDTDSHLALIGCLDFPEGNIHDLKFNGNGTIVLVAGGRGAHSGKVVLFDVKSGKRVGEFGDEVDAVLAADISHDNQFIALGNSKRTVKIFDTKQGEMIHKIKKHTDWITSISFSPNGKYVATGDRSGGVHVWEPDKGLIVYTLDEHKQAINDLEWRSDSRILASGAEDGVVVLWDMKDGFPIRNFKAHVAVSESRYTRKTGVLSIDFTKDGGLITSGRDNLLQKWGADGSLESTMTVGTSLVIGASKFSQDQEAVAGTLDGYLHLFDLKSKRQVQKIAVGK